MEADLLVISRIILIIISLTIVFILIKIRFQGRIGNQFFIILNIFWSAVIIIGIYPNILDTVLNSIGLANRAQFLLILAVLVIVYLLYSQIIRNKELFENHHKVIRKIAISNFKTEYKDEFSRSSQVLIVIVAKDESKIIGDVIDKINLIKLPFSYRILVVNDGSIDDTEEIARRKNVLVITHHINLGIGGAVKTGYLATCYFNPEYVINLDADGQHDPKYIPEIIAKLKESDLVYGSRFSKNSKYQTNAVRFAGNKFYTKLVNNLGGINITDVTSGFRGIRYEKINSIFFVAETNFAIELALRAARNHLQIDEISIESDARKTGKSQFFKIEKFFIYNFNAFNQIFSAFLRKPEKIQDSNFNKSHTDFKHNDIYKEK